MDTKWTSGWVVVMTTEYSGTTLSQTCTRMCRGVFVNCNSQKVIYMNNWCSSSICQPSCRAIVIGSTTLLVSPRYIYGFTSCNQANMYYCLIAHRKCYKRVISTGYFLCYRRFFIGRCDLLTSKLLCA